MGMGLNKNCEALNFNPVGQLLEYLRLWKEYQRNPSAINPVITRPATASKIGRLYALCLKRRILTSDLEVQVRAMYQALNELHSANTIKYVETAPATERYYYAAKRGPGR